MTVMIPTIHLNGTSRESLSDQLCNAYDALRTAERALCQAAPNGRDYYPQGDQAISRATEQHRARLAKLGEVMKEIEAIAEAIAN